MYASFHVSIRVIDKAKRQKLREEIMKKLDTLENLYLPQVDNNFCNRNEMRNDGVTFSFRLRLCLTKSFSTPSNSWILSQAA